MLFISSEEIGKAMIKYRIDNYLISKLTVNEQNPSAKGFYEHMGFHVYKRIDKDRQGNPYPLLYIKLCF